MWERALRKLARDQWVRIHGTPRVSVLVGDAGARGLWDLWLALAGVDGTLIESVGFAEAIAGAIAEATTAPVRPIGVVVTAEGLAAWRESGPPDRSSALVDEGVVEVPRAAPTSTTTRPTNLDARSLAEAVLFDALEATPATAGRFALNESLSVRFGPRAAEVDLLSRRDRIAIEIDGIHHFADPDCYRRDRAKDLLLQTEGLLVVRLLAEDVMRDVRGAVTTVCRALAATERGQERAR